MHCHGTGKRSILDDTTQLNFADKMFLTSIKSPSFDEAGFFSRVGVGSIPFIIKITRHSSHFLAMCQKKERQLLWRNLYSLYGLFLSSDKSCSMAFYEHKASDVCYLKLLQGAYYYQLAVNVLKAEDEPFTSMEIYLLEKAMQFDSIHATQRYIQYLYSRVDNGRYSSNEEAEELLIKAIRLCKSSDYLELYGSYTYMMLAEGYFRYANWLVNSSPSPLQRASKAVEAAMNACDKAANRLDESRHSILNASLGEGLKASNSFGFSNPEQGKKYLESWARNNGIGSITCLSNLTPSISVMARLH